MFYIAKRLVDLNFEKQEGNKTVTQTTPMIFCPNMVIIGSTSRHVGKTEFACQLIKQQAQHQPVFGIKITTIRESNSPCPRGGSGCGVCSDLDQDYIISEEFDRTTPKDTGRMLRAGARRVFWLRTRHHCLTKGAADLLARIPAGAPVVCESSSARCTINPGVFLIIKESMDAHSTKVPDSIYAKADRLPLFLGDSWDFSPDQCRFTQGRWHIPFKASAVILAGGKSRRMGQDKSLMLHEGKPLIERVSQQIKPYFNELLISSNRPDQLGFLNCPILVDSELDCGPVMGITTALEQAKHELLFVLGCDIPDIDIPFVESLYRLAQTADAVVPMGADKRPEPLFAFYRRTVLPNARALLARGGRRVIDILPGLHVQHPLMRAQRYTNLNTPDDFNAWKAMQGEPHDSI